MAEFPRVPRDDGGAVDSAERLGPGLRLERYRIETLLGEGGMGTVYRAHDLLLDRRVAIKVLRRASAVAPAGRLVREARAAAALNHPNVVSVYDVGEADGTTYIVMELLEGKSLARYVGDDGISLEAKVGWLLDVARALAAAHERGLVHRDVKPENVIVGTDGSARVLDFGIAKRIEAPVNRSAETVSERGGAVQAAWSTSPGRVVGTPRFMAPEQIRGGAVDGRTDQFSWGLVAYELLTGVHAWSTLSRASIPLEEAICEVHPRRPNEVAPGVPAWLDHIVWRALAKPPEMRFAEMRDVVAALELGGEGRGPRPRSTPGRRDSVDATSSSASPLTRAPPDDPNPTNSGTRSTRAARGTSTRLASAVALGLVLIGVVVVVASYIVRRSWRVPVLVHSAVPRGSASAELDAFFDARREAMKVPGLAVASVKNGRVVWARGYGLANVAEARPVSEDTLFMVQGPVASTVIGVLLMHLVESSAGGITLDQDIAPLLPAPGRNPEHPGVPITLRMLLTHSSTLGSNELVKVPVAGDSPEPLREWLRRFLARRDSWLKETPGEVYRYAGAEVSVAGYLVEALSAASLEEYSRATLFQPLGMYETSWFLSGLDPSHIAMPYQRSHGALVPQGLLGFPDYPDGQLRTSAAQLARFVGLLAGRGEFGGVRVLRAVSVDEMLRPQLGRRYAETGPGLFLWRQHIRSRAVIGNNGTWRGTDAEMGFDPTTGAGYVLLMNGDAPAIHTPERDALDETSLKLLALADETLP